MAYLRTIHPCLAITCLLFLFSSIGAHNDGFSVKLIRRNSSNDSYKPSTIQSAVSAYQSEYLMELSIGTPPIKTYAEADTGSDLIWFQCIPCTNCYKQQNPMFDPQSSSTCTNITCGSESCNKLGSNNLCSTDQNTCNYTYSYADNSITQGVLAQETLTLTSTTGEPMAFQGIIFGCGHNDSGFNDREMGLIGLGRGPLSLISQIGSSLGGNMFSQCLVPFNTDPSITSQMNFGKGSEVLGNGTVSTPLISKDGSGYFASLIGISVEDINLPFSDGSSSGIIAKGNILIDSGTTITYLPEEFYHRLIEQVRNKVALEPFRISDYELCYQTPTNLNGPTLTVHFEGGDVLLTPAQMFVPVEGGNFCFAVFKTSEEYVTYGNYAQSNYLIGFDLERQIVSFKATDCTKF